MPILSWKYTNYILNTFNHSTGEIPLFNFVANESGIQESC